MAAAGNSGGEEGSLGFEGGKPWGRYRGGSR